MCGRFAFTSPVESVARFFSANTDALPDFPPNTNVCPTQNIITVVSHDNQISLSKMRWGFVPHWYKTLNDGPLLINARAETIDQKPAYRDAFQSRRCIIPVNWYYEWSQSQNSGKKKKYKIAGQNAEFLACAAIWQAWREQDGTRLVSCAMITQDANKAIEPVHHRMPVILPSDQINSWLRSEPSSNINFNVKENDSLFQVSLCD